MDKWTNIDAGPRQIKDLLRAISALTREGSSHDEITGVIGGKEHTFSTWSPFGGTRPEAVALDEAIKAKFGGKITKKNVREIAAAYLAAVPELRKSRPVEDNRRSKDEDDVIQAQIAEREADYAAKRAAEQSLLGKVTEKAPPGAQALIVAQYNVDNSDTMTDYFSNQTKRTVAIGWRTGGREDFRQLHRAAAQFPETAHLASDEALQAWHADRDPDRRYPHQSGDGSERRDNYSMGKGNYLSDHGWDGAGSGWVVKSYALPAKWVNLTEDAIPEAAPAVSAGGRRAWTDSEIPDGALDRALGGGEVTVTPGFREGVVEVRFASKPSPEQLAAMKAHGFRWARGSHCWYGRDRAYAESLAAACCGECKGEDN